MTANAYGRCGRDELLARIAELEAERNKHASVMHSMEVDLAHAQESYRHASCECQEHIDHVLELKAENARLSKEHATMLETLTHAQTRGSELQDEVRALRRVLARWFKDCADVSWSYEEQRSLQFEILVDLLKVRWRGDCKYGTAGAHADFPLGLGDPIEHETRVAARRDLEELHAFKKVRGNHSHWKLVLEEEWLELITSESEERAEAEALDLANVCLKMVESIRIRRARGAR